MVLSMLEESFSKSSLEQCGQRRIYNNNQEMTVTGAEDLPMRTRKGQLLMFRIHMWYSF